MLKGLFGKKDKKPQDKNIYAHANGEMLPLEKVPDPVFAQRMMGDGAALDPSDGNVVSPADGRIVQVFPTKHAVGIKAANGAEILIHIGLETVSMNGEGFTSHVSEGDKVKKGDLLITFDMELVKEKAKSTIIPIIITDGAGDGIQNVRSSGSVTAGEEVIFTLN